MPDVNLIFRAHLSLLRWGQERLAQETGDADELAGEAASPAVDGSEETATDSIQRATCYEIVGMNRTMV